MQFSTMLFFRYSFSRSVKLYKEERDGWVASTFFTSLTPNLDMQAWKAIIIHDVERIMYDVIF